MGNWLESQFEKMGARARERELQKRVWQRRRWLMQNSDDVRVRLDIARDARGEYFDIQAAPKRASLEVVDVQPRRRHLLLMSRDAQSGAKEKFLCGHDERAWFVAAVPGRSVSSVATAFEALKPPEVLQEQDRRQLSGRQRTQRRTPAFVRQGEWFFIPVAYLDPPSSWILRHEPLRRGNGKPHIAEQCVRMGGQTVYVSRRYPNGLLEDAYRALIEQNPNTRLWGWQVMLRDAVVYVRGCVRHPDHKTIRLDVWHRVLVNTESNAPAMRHVAFLD